MEAGVTGLDSIHWGGERDGNEALDPSVSVVRTSRDWANEACRHFLTDAYNALCDAFDQPRVDEDAVSRILAG